MLLFVNQLQTTKPWMCNKCDYRTYYKGNLTKHLRNIHFYTVEVSHSWGIIEGVDVSMYFDRDFNFL